MGGIVLLLLVGAAPAAGASPAPNGPQLGGTFLPDGTLVILWTPDAYTSLSSFQVITPGALLYGSTLDIEAANPSTNARSLTVDIEQFAPGTTVEPVPVVVGNRTVLENETVPIRQDPAWENSSFPVAGHTVSADAIQLPVASSTLSVVVSVENVSFPFQHLTPNFLFPVPQTVGGLEALAIGETAWTGILAAGAAGLARRTMRVPGIGAPRAPILWAGFGLVAGAFVWFTASPVSFLQTAGGSSPLLFPLVFAVLFFFWALRHFDRSELVEVEQPHWTVPLTFSKLYLRTSRTATGETFLSLRSWKGWLYPLLGHPIPIETREGDEPGDGGPPYGATARSRRLLSARERREVLRAVSTLQDAGTAPPAKVREAAQGWVVDSDDPAAPERKYKLDSDRKVRFTPWSFRWTRTELAETEASQTPGQSTGPRRTRRRFSPHIEGGSLSLPLTGVAYLDEEAAALDGSRIERLARALEVARFQVLTVDRRVHSEADRQTKERVGVLTGILAQESVQLDETDAEQEVREARRRQTKPKSENPKE